MEAAVLTGAALAAALAWGSLPVREVVIDAPGVAEPERLRRDFGIRPGDTLSRLEVRRGVHALIASGRVEDVVVEVEEGEGGVVVRVKAQVASTISRVSVAGLSRRHERLVRQSADLHPGAVLRLADFEQAVRRSLAVLRADGYPQATLEGTLEFERGTAEVAVHLDGNAGPPLLAGAIEAPAAGLSPPELWKATGLRPGERLAQRTLAAARAALARHLRRQGFWEAEVGLPRVSGSGDRATVTIDVQRGPRFRLDWAGERLTKALRQEALPFLDGAEGFSEATLGDTVRAVRTWAQRRGHLLARVEGEVGDGEDGRTLRLRADFGPRLPIEGVDFPGAAGIDWARLRPHLSVGTGRLGRMRGEPVDDATLAADAASLRAALMAEGYAQVEVEPVRLVRGTRGVRVEFPVRLGPRWTVREFQLEGWPGELAEPELPLVVGGPWSQAAEEATQGRLTDVLQRAGYADARATARHECSAATCAVTVAVEPGAKVVLGRVMVAGLGRTDPAVVDRVAGLVPGQVLTPDDTLAATRRLLALGIFRKARTRPLPGSDVGGSRDLVLDLSEAPTRSLGFGLGWDTEARTSVSLSWSELNLFGTGRALSLDARYSAREARWQVSFREPAELGLVGVPVWVSVFRTEETYDTYDLLRRGMWVEFGDRRRLPRRALLRYDYEITDPTAPAEILSELEREHQRAKIASLTAILEADSRDDVFDPHRGVQLSLQYQNAFPIFDADAAFHKVSLLASGYASLKRGVLVGSTRLGGIEPKHRFHDTPDNLLLPIAVRYFAGGRISHRAFPIDRLGIVGETLDAAGNPLGGAGLALVNVEWRFPLAGVVGGALFVDGGNVWSAWRRMTVADLRWGAGLGVRVTTPIGPVRLEYGWKLDRQVGESAGELFFAFGNPF